VPHNERLVVVSVIGVALVAGLVASNSCNEHEPTVATEGPRNTSYVIEGRRVLLRDGLAETEAAPGSASTITTRHVGHELKTDLDGDGREDVAFLLTQEGGGSGTFFYVVGALATDRGYIGSDGYPLGDRIAPQAIEPSKNPRHENVIVVSYADREAGEPMSAPPSVGKSVHLKLVPASMQWGIVEPDFEGEAR
jgi:hypothetical protein